MKTCKIYRYSREELLENIEKATSENNRLREMPNLSSFGVWSIEKNRKDIAKYQHWLNSCTDDELYIFSGQVVNKELHECMKF